MFSEETIKRLQLEALHAAMKFSIINGMDPEASIDSANREWERLYPGERIIVPIPIQVS